MEIRKPHLESSSKGWRLEWTLASRSRLQLNFIIPDHVFYYPNPLSAAHCLYVTDVT